MARMLGRFRRGGCWSGAPGDSRRCTAPGPDCSGRERDTRWRKRAEARELARELAPEADSDWLTRIDPAFDASGCVHGCSGSPSCTGERCTFVCHS